MDAYEATRIVFSRIQSLDPENASKIMGLLLIQDHGEKEMIRLAFGPEAVVHSVVLKARKDLGLGLSSNTSSAPLSPSSNSISRQNSFSSSSSRLINGSLNFHSSSSWAPSSFSDLHNPDDLVSPNSTSSAYAAAVNGFNNTVVGSLSSSESASSASLFYGSNSDLIDEFQIQDQLSFLNDSSTNLGPKNSDLFYPQQESSYAGANWGGSINGQQHRRSCSVTDICMGSDAGSGFGWKPCLYFARGYCKNGTSCRFLHGLTDTTAAAVGDAAAAAIVGSPGKLDVIEQCHELLRSKNPTQQRLGNASQLMASSSFPYSSAAGKCMNFLLQQQQQQNDTQRVAAAAAALMMGEDIHKFGHSRLERNEFSTTGMVNPGSRQIYLTFPADSTFREEDVSNYFSIYGPVQDVRIPYQQKRMFGFVTFVYPETVKLILAKGNPHFVCDARVLVKPYKEKGKVPDKYRKQQQQQQQAERGDFSPCTTPSGLDSRETYDLQLGARMFYNTQDLLMRRKLEEQADLQQAIELHGRRLIGLQLLDVKKQQHQRNLSAGASIPSPSYSPMNQNLIIPSDLNSLETSPENYVSRATTISTVAVAVADEQVQQAVKAQEVSFSNDNGKEKIPSNEDSVDHNLPDSPFASPTKSAGDHLSIFTNAVTEETERSAQALPSSSSPPSSNTNNNNNIITPSLLPASSTLDVASLKSCYFQMPRFSSGHGAIEM